MPVYNPPTYREQYTKIVGFDAATCDYVCDGVADDVQINQAIAAIIALYGSGCVALQRGTYDITSTIDLNGTGVRLCGTGMATVLQVSVPISAVITITQIPVAVDQLRILGDSKANYGIYINDVGSYTIRNVYSSECAVAAIYSHFSEAGTGDSCINNNVFDTNQVGILFDVGNANITVEANAFSNTIDYDINCAGNSIVMFGNTIFNSDGILVTGDYCSISNNSFNVANIEVTGESNTVGGNSVYGNIIVSGKLNSVTGNTLPLHTITLSGNGNAIVGNIVSIPAGHGIVGSDAFNCTINGNSVDSVDRNGSNSYDAINLDDCVDMTVSGNILTNSLAKNCRDGIHLSTDCANITITGNRIKGYDVGVNVAAASCVDSMVGYNDLTGNGTAFLNSGTGTKENHNVGNVGFYQSGDYNPDWCMLQHGAITGVPCDGTMVAAWNTNTGTPGILVYMNGFWRYCVPTSPPTCE